MILGFFLGDNSSGNDDVPEARIIEMQNWSMKMRKLPQNGITFKIPSK